MLELHNNRLDFNFPEVHPEAKCSITFLRTLRTPDDGKTYPLPQGFGNFPLRHVDSHKESVSEDTLRRGGVMLPMYQSEAMYLSFQSKNVAQQGTYPFAIKIAAGKRSAVTAHAWVDGLVNGDYIVIPKQLWLDGFVVSPGKVRQFVAAPLGMGFTVEEQLTGEAEFGGLQIEVYPMLREEFDKRFPKRVASHFRGGMLGSDVRPAGAVRRRMSKGFQSLDSMGMAAGGMLSQEIHPDSYGLQVWDTAHKSRTFVHLMNSLVWKQITGQNPPQVPITTKDYEREGFPWFEYYSDGGAVGPSEDSNKIKSVTQLAEEKGFTILPENESTQPTKIVGIHAPKNPDAVKDGSW